MSLKKEIGRKVFHFLWFFVLLGYLSLYDRIGDDALLLPFAVLMIALVIDFFRIEYKLSLGPLSKLLHTKESSALFTPTTTMFAFVIAVTVFGNVIAAAAITIMTFGDVAGNIVGRMGKITLRNGKHLEGAVANFVVGGAAAYFFLPQLSILLPMAAAGAVVELFTDKLNDNMTVILAAGTVGFLISIAGISF